jgi:hypothetical protein
MPRSVLGAGVLGSLDVAVLAACPLGAVAVVGQPTRHGMRSRSE